MTTKHNNILINCNLHSIFKKNRAFIFWILFFCGMNLFSGQNAKNFENKNLSFRQIEEKIDQLHNNKVEMWKMIKFYIQKSKAEKNHETLVYAYRYATNFSEFPENFKYADSAIAVANSSKNQRLLANAYMNRGVVQMGQVQYQKALDDILLAKKYADEINSEYVIYKSKYLIAQNKIYLGLYEEANKELLECIDFFKSNLNDASLGKDYQTYYLYSLMSIIDTNSKLGTTDNNEKLLDEAFVYIKNNDLKMFVPYFISLEGTEAYYKKDYNLAIKKLSEALSLYKDQWSHITEIYYLGLSYWKLGKQNVAIKYFEQIDKVYNKENNLEPQFRAAYEHLIRHNDSIGNKDKQLEYINKLMILDRSYEKNYKYLYSKINKEYDSKKLLEEKSRIERSLKFQYAITILLLAITFFTIIFFARRYYLLQQRYDKRFQELLRETKKSPVPSFVQMENKEESLYENTIEMDEETDYYNKIRGMNPILVKNILKQLDDFENNEEFLDSQVSQKLLSEKLGTNSTYLSKIVNVYKGKNFNIYVNDLRLDYILNLLKSDWDYLNKDVKELAAASGFTNTENFSDNFQRKFEIKPSYFIKKMKENVVA